MKNQFKLLAVTLLSISLITSCFNEKKDTFIEYKILIDKYIEYWNTGQFDNIHDILSENFEIRATPQFEPEKGIDTFKETILNVRKSYPDFHITVNEIFFSADAAAARWTIQTSKKTGKEMNIKGMSIIHFVEGKIKDEWISNNDLSWLQQLDYVIMPPSTVEEK